MPESLILLIGLPGFIILINFLGFLFTGNQILRNHITGNMLFSIAEVGSMLILPAFYGGFGSKNDCCEGSMGTAVFSPEHQLTIGIIIVLCLTAYFYASYRTKMATPVIEILVNALLLTGIVLNIFIAIHTKEVWLAIGGNVPVILLAIVVLAKNQRLFMAYSANNASGKNNRLEKMAWTILSLKPIHKFPILLVLCLPLLVILTSLLLLFGQKPDSLIRAFTDTYKHGLSQIDYQCDNVQCGGHYLCSVAANGHKKMVKPQRLGYRNGHTIICNRQLLISNAFENLIQEKFPFFHKFIRKNYDKVGNFIHRYYHIFNNKLFSDFIYLLMKPLEWFFLLILYTLDMKPENRIARQYLKEADRLVIDKLETFTTNTR
ncbi:MAG: hypothetical protein H7Y04_03280 [Verrucomicrobia bacterium]|nr:hypothetical protein [Cytophagales bacterium]